MKKTALLLLFVFIYMVGSVHAELSFSGGYLSQDLGTSEKYNAFLKERYGAENIVLTGNALAIMYKKAGGKWKFGLESDDLSGTINYTTLNSEQQSNLLKLQQTILLMARTNKNITWTAGIGSNKLTRTFYGYQNAGIVTTNLSSNSGTAESTTSGSVYLGQGLYRLLGDNFSLDLGGRYSISYHEIAATDARPGYNSSGIPTTMNFSVGGLAFLGVLTIKF